MIKTKTTFIKSLLIAVVGFICWVSGLAAAFGKAGNWSEYLTLFGMLLLAIAGFMNLYAFWKGMQDLRKSKKMKTWWILCTTIMLGSLYGGWIVINL